VERAWLSRGQRLGWHANGAYGGSASGGDGSWHATGANGGTASGGDGSWHATGAYGGTAYGGYKEPTTVYGGSYYGTYHPPTTVNYYGSGCYSCGGWNTGAVAAAGAAGLATGAAIGAANANAYAAGTAAGTTATGYVMNNIYATLPAGCFYDQRNGAAYYACGPTWFKPSYGANGIYYRVVPYPG